MTQNGPAKYGFLNRTLRKTRRGLYELRAYIPGLAFGHRCERMVGPVGYWKQLQQYQFNVLEANGLKPHHSLLDLGCGPLQGGVPFIRYLGLGGYTGVDITPEHIDAACRQVVLNHLATKNPRLILSDKFGDDFLGAERFDFIWASQILYLFDEPTMSALFAFVAKRLKSGGRFLGDIVNPEKRESVSALYSDYVHYTLDSINQLALAAGLRVRSLGEIIQYKYPARLTLRQSVMLEFTLID